MKLSEPHMSTKEHVHLSNINVQTKGALMLSVLYML